jgi:hypothetical protein
MLQAVAVSGAPSVSQQQQMVQQQQQPMVLGAPSDPQQQQHMVQQQMVLGAPSVPQQQHMVQQQALSGASLNYPGGGVLQSLNSPNLGNIDGLVNEHIINGELDLGALHECILQGLNSATSFASDYENIVGYVGNFIGENYGIFPKPDVLKQLINKCGNVINKNTMRVESDDAILAVNSQLGDIYVFIAQRPNYDSSDLKELLTSKFGMDNCVYYSRMINYIKNNNNGANNNNGSMTGVYQHHH